MKMEKQITGRRDAAIAEFCVRLDELNEHANRLDPVVVAQRLADIADTLTADLFPHAAAQDDPKPNTREMWLQVHAIPKGSRSAS